MPAAPQSIIDTRRHQMFPVLESTDIERVRRFGKIRFYRAGEALVQVGNIGPGLTIILTGRVVVRAPVSEVWDVVGEALPYWSPVQRAQFTTFCWQLRLQSWESFGRTARPRAVHGAGWNRMRGCALRSRRL